MEVYEALREQTAYDAQFTIRALGIQLLVNLVVSIFVLGCVSWLRPRHYLASPATKSSITTDTGKTNSELGWFDWIKQLARVSDDFLIDRIGFDAVMFLRFMRTLRNLLIIMTIVAVAILMPLNVLATQHTGDWPPIAFDIGFLSISSINLVAGKEPLNPQDNWYWPPVVATWLFTILILVFLHRASNDYLIMRKQFYSAPAYNLSSRSILISNIPKNIRSSEEFKTWLESTCNIHYPIQQIHIGQDNPKLMSLVRKYKKAVCRLEDALAAYARDASGRRPIVRTIKSWFSCFPGSTGKKKQLETIDHYTKQVSDLYHAIRHLPANKNINTTDYGWVTFSSTAWAQSALQSLNKRKVAHATAQVSPPANDLIWSNMSISREKRVRKLWIGRAFFTAFTIAWTLPVAALAMISNIVNMIRMYPESKAYIDKYWFILGLVEAYIAPCTMAILFFALPRFFRRLVNSQGYLTRSHADQKVLIMLYTFFIANHLVVFTITSVFLGIYGQLRQLVLDGVLADEIISEYVAQLAKNIADFSCFWINVVCVKAFGVSLEVVQVIPVVMIRLRRLFIRSTPRRLKKLLSPPNFEFAQNYNIVLFFFTIALMYSTTSPLVLPFALIYFSAASFVYKYMLMYIYVTKVETGGSIWPAVYHSTMFSTVIFQLVSAILIILKGGFEQGCVILPLPVLTLIYQFFYTRRLNRIATSIIATMITHHAHHNGNPTWTLEYQYCDPRLQDTHLMPIIHSNMRSLLGQIYPKYKQGQVPLTSTSDITTTTTATAAAADDAISAVAQPSIHSTNDICPINPNYNDDQHITLYNPTDNRSVMFQTVSDAFYLHMTGDHYNSNNASCTCCGLTAAAAATTTMPHDEKSDSAVVDAPIHHANDSDFREPSAPPVELLFSPPSSSSKTDMISTAQQHHHVPCTEVSELDWDRHVMTAQQHQHPAAPRLSIGSELPTYRDAMLDRPVIVVSPASPSQHHPSTTQQQQQIHMHPVQAIPRRRHSDPAAYNNPPNDG
ncbi:duf221 domain [Lichtheimia corymbifera JMRC:FSU:9682]|uniref:Duf221 domain n=1 Tax=Lichtheimia corymbifera JMRC:FSU:9682 TaxID=1263082 RepID=A0A068RGX7_9FUNG|nr:duf221 domain [Lichtheimia corymbifera JMRC:FSU:9682]